MRSLYVTSEQAQALAADLLEYAGAVDNRGRAMFAGFKISYGDMLAENLQPEEAFEVSPLSNILEIPADPNAD